MAAVLRCPQNILSGTQEFSLRISKSGRGELRKQRRGSQEEGAGVEARQQEVVVSGCHLGPWVGVCSPLSALGSVLVAAPWV